MNDNNYCTLFPDKINGVDISKCCKQHDIAYSLQIEKKSADIELYNCIKDLEESNPFVQIIALIVFGGVWWFGRLWWYLAGREDKTIK